MSIKGKRAKSKRTVLKKKVRKPFEWANLEDAALLDMRICDLNLSIEGTGLEDRIQLLYRELAARGLNFRPHFWLSDEWFCPSGSPGIAIPFYLAHPRLAKLEHSQMLEVEGGTHESFMKIIRHEVGHAIDHGYRLSRNPMRRKLFGRTSVPYPEFYSPKPYSKSFVVHLDSWYAQAHPDEDFAETFAVWLSPDNDWRERYAGWAALKKLQFMDSLMLKLRGKKQPVKKRATLDPVSKLKKTLREHYAEKRERYSKQHRGVYDRDLRKLFSNSAQFQEAPLAAAFIRKIRREVRVAVARWTGEYQYRIDQIIQEILGRCVELKLRLVVPMEQAKVDFTVLLAVQTMNYLHSGRHRIAL